MKSNLFLKIKIAVFILISCAGISFLYVANDARIAFSYNIQDRGDIFQGGDGRFKFPFQNTGRQPLIISMVKSSCGCLIGYGPREPVMVGEWDTIFGKYDTNRMGPISKSLTVTCNDSLQPQVVLRIKGNVVAKPLNIKLFDLFDSSGIKISEYNQSEINFADRKQATIEIKNELDYDRKISWKVSENLKIETNKTFTTWGEEETGVHEKVILSANESMIIKITVLKTDEYRGNQFGLNIDGTILEINLKNN